MPAAMLEQEATLVPKFEMEASTYSREPLVMLELGGELALLGQERGLADFLTKQAKPPKILRLSFSNFLNCYSSVYNFFDIHLSLSSQLCRGRLTNS